MILESSQSHRELVIYNWVALSAKSKFQLSIDMPFVYVKLEMSSQSEFILRQVRDVDCNILIL